MNKVIVVLGPTGVGKTKMSVELARVYNGEIINADAMQVYKDLNIGTAKIREDEKEGIPHHLFDIKNIDEEYSIYDYQKDCRKKIDEILSRGKTPIMVGGTGLYIKSALYDYTLNMEESNDNDYEEIETDILYKRLRELDKDIDIDRNNRRRVIRALNYYLTYNKSISLNKDGNNLLYDSIFIGLTTDRKILYDRINKRVDLMIENGLLDEVKYFYDNNMRYKPLISGIGYKELYDYFDGKTTIEDAIELIKRNSRRYAKRQYTFFNNQMNVKWFDVDFNNFDNTIEDVISYLSQF